MTKQQEIDQILARAESEERQINNRERSRLSELEGFMQVEYIDPKEDQCLECECSFGVHLISCSHFTPRK